MHRSSRPSPLPLLLGCALLLASCDTTAPPTAPAHPLTSDGAAVSADLTNSVTPGCLLLDTRSLLAEREVRVGDVSVSTDGEALIVAVTTDPDRPFGAIHVAAALSLGEIPVNPHGNAAPGHFAYGGDLAAPATEAVIRIPYSDLPGLAEGDDVFLAVHAEVGEGAWAEGDYIDGTEHNGWAMYFTVAAGFSCGCGDVLTFADPGLERAVRERLQKPTGEITAEEGESITFLYADGHGIRDIGGIECLVNLRHLDLTGNEVADITELGELSLLSQLQIADNLIEDLSPLSALRFLRVVLADGNRIGDVQSLDGVPLVRLSIQHNELTNLAGLGNSPTLRYLFAGHNRITDISGISGLPNLYVLDVTDNSISDTSPLLTIGSNLVYFHVYAADNAIADLTTLHLLRFKLRTLVVYGNPFGCSDPLLIDMRVILNLVTGC